MSVSKARKDEIRKMVRDRLIEELRAASKGETEAVFKEVWEHCEDDAELAVADGEIKRCLAHIKELAKP
jgi:hypothetical protein